MERLSYLYELIECGYPLEHWSYAADGHLIESNSDNERILDILFSAGGIKDYMMDYGKEHSMPLILSSSLGNMWAAVFDSRPDHDISYHVLGPVFPDVVSPQTLERRADGYEKLPLNWKQQFIRIVEQFPVVPWTVLAQYTVMLHYTVTGERITISDFAYQRTPSPAPAARELTDREEKQNLPRRAEQALFNNIREGNLNYKSALSAASLASSGVQIDVGDPLRRAKNSGIIFAALSARAAIEGGLPSETAYAVQNRYTQSIEDCRNISGIAALNHQMYEDFIARVHKIRELKNISPQIRGCISYIEMHADEELSLRRLADAAGYSEYYLSRRFKAETGKSVNAFITQQRIMLAKNLLETSTLDIQEISEQLRFCSRSYFADVFRRLTGISPTQYRAQHRQT